MSPPRTTSPSSGLSSQTLPAYFSAIKLPHQAWRDSISRSVLSRLLNYGDLLYQYFGRAVVRIAPDIAVKINRSKDVTELSNLQHTVRATAASQTTIPVPSPLGMLSVAHFCYIFTSFVPGIPLDRIWGNLTSHQKGHVRDQLNRISSELRSLPPPFTGRIAWGRRKSTRPQGPSTLD